jgi:hypothetical protein
MAVWKQVSDTRIPARTTEADFCRIFSEDMNSLYWLSMLLTADELTAEQCFVSGLGDCVEGNPVFGEWAHSWARRTIIQNAIRMIAPQPAGDRNPGPRERTVQNHGIVRAAAAVVLGLDPFARFVFVMSVLERYSDQDICALLGASRLDVADARVRALAEIGAHKLESDKSTAISSSFGVTSTPRSAIVPPVPALLARSA